MYNSRFMDFGTIWASITRAVMLVFHMNPDIGSGCKNTKTFTTTPGTTIQFLKIGTNSGLCIIVMICNASKTGFFKDVWEHRFFGAAGRSCGVWRLYRSWGKDNRDCSVLILRELLDWIDAFGPDHKHYSGISLLDFCQSTAWWSYQPAFYNLQHKSWDKWILLCNHHHQCEKIRLGKIEKFIKKAVKNTWSTDPILCREKNDFIWQIKL